MSKTAQRKAAAWERGAKDGFEGRARNCNDRRVKKDYDQAYDAGKSDRDRNYKLSKMTPEQRAEYDAEMHRRREEHGPDPT